MTKIKQLFDRNKINFIDQYPLNGLETSRLEKAISPHKIERHENETSADILSRDLVAINEFLYYVDAEPFIINPEKAENYKRVAFKKTTASNAR